MFGVTNVLGTFIRMSESSLYAEINMQLIHAQFVYY
jgi:hypothetical protein